MSTDNPQSGAMKLAHVLFMDIVGYSKLPIDEQMSALHVLQELVHASVEVVRAQATDQLIGFNDSCFLSNFLISSRRLNK